ncbi:hypothetical protein EC988_005609, partial [Linderina pennispora]
MPFDTPPPSKRRQEVAPSAPKKRKPTAVLAAHDRSPVPFNLDDAQHRHHLLDGSTRLSTIAEDSILDSPISAFPVSDPRTPDHHDNAHAIAEHPAAEGDISALPVSQLTTPVRSSTERRIAENPPCDKKPALFHSPPVTKPTKAKKNDAPVNPSTVKNSKQTPVKSTANNSTVQSNKVMSPSDLKAERDKEASLWVSECLLGDIDAVLGLLQARSKDKADLAAEITDHISAELECHLGAANDMAANRTGAATVHPSTRQQQQQQPQPPPTSDPHPLPVPPPSPDTQAMVESLNEWISSTHAAKSTAGASGRAERKMYLPIQQFSLFVAKNEDRFIRAQAGSNAKYDAVHRRHILPYRIYDCAPVGKDDDRRVDIGLATRELSHKNKVVALVKDPVDYSDMLAVVE